MAVMETVVAVAIGILSTIFVVSLVALIFVCRQRCRRRDLISQLHRETRLVISFCFFSLNAYLNGLNAHLFPKWCPKIGND
jgi:hypothetical protein